MRMLEEQEDAWAVVTNDAGVRHVIPIAETHDDEALTCWCKPREVSEGIVVHNSRDMREFFEKSGRKPA